MKKLLSSLLAASIAMQCGAVSSLAAWHGDTNGKTALCSIDFSKVNELETWEVKKTETEESDPDNAPVLAIGENSIQDMTAPYLTVTNPKQYTKADMIRATKSFTPSEENGIVRTKFKYSSNHGNSNADILITDDNGNGIVIGSAWWPLGNVGSPAYVDGELQQSVGNEQNRVYTNTISNGISSAAYAIGNSYYWDLGANGWGRMWRNIEVVANTSGKSVSTTIAGKDITLGKGVYAVADTVTLNSASTNIYKGYLPEMGAFSKFSIVTKSNVREGTQTRLDDISVEYEPLTYVNDSEYANWKGVVWGDFAYELDADSASKIISSDAADMSDLGVGWTRIFVGAGYDQDRIESLVRAANNKGIKVLMTYIKKSGSTVYGTAEEEAAEMAYLSSLVNKYKGVTSYWEIGNEPNLDWLNKNKDSARLENYAKHLRDCYNTIKSVDDDATVILGGLSEYYATDWVNAFTEITVDGKPAYKYFDEAAFHPYADNPASAISKATAFKNAVKTSWGEMPIWITEIGFHAMTDWNSNNTPGKVASEEVKAEYLTTVMNGLHESLGDIQRPVMWYILHEKIGNGNGYGLVTKSADEHGVMKNVLAAYAKMKSLKPGAEFASELPINDTFDETDGTIPDGWSFNIAGSASEGSVGVSAVSLAGHEGYLAVKKNDTNSPHIVSAERSFNIPNNGGLINISFDYIAQGDKKGYGKSIVLMNDDTSGISIAAEPYNGINIVLSGYLTGNDTDEKTILTEEKEEWFKFDITVNCSNSVLSGLQPGEYTLSCNGGEALKGILKNGLTSLNKICFTSGVYVSSSIGVDNLSITEKEVPAVIGINRAYAENGNANITFSNTKASVDTDICIAAYKDNVFSRIVKIQNGFIIPKGDSSLKLPLGNIESGESYKVFVWNSMENMTPVMESASF